MRIFSLRIIVIKLFSIGGFPLEEAREHFFPINKGIILVLWFHILCCYDITLFNISIFLYSNRYGTSQVVS